ncbi:MAG: 2-C-methyl-D-erythritol 4-phosphate cytidylyltransferase [Pseudomonadales bacterium]|nr:2-C-methyl-D-erythritol 4-phosphate cytidylyltransferase [Pseudomonadales bacterium]
MNDTTRLWCVVPAAGVGKRFGSAVPKQYLQVNGARVVEHTLNRLLQLSEIEQVVVAISNEDQQFRQLPVASHQRVTTVVGGDERCHSVLNGLRLLSGVGEEQDWVLVHDVARPCVRPEDIRKLVQQVQQLDAVGGILANPVRDTMKRANPINQIVETVDRRQLWHALTPQLFRLGALRQALETALEAGVVVTDEASAMEHGGHQPLLVEGHCDNIKITHPQDLHLASLYLQQQ